MRPTSAFSGGCLELFPGAMYYILVMFQLMECLVYFRLITHPSIHFLLFETQDRCRISSYLWFSISRKIFSQNYRFHKDAGCIRRQTGEVYPPCLIPSRRRFCRVLRLLSFIPNIYTSMIYWYYKSVGRRSRIRDRILNGVGLIKRGGQGLAYTTSIDERSYICQSYTSLIDLVLARNIIIGICHLHYDSTACRTAQICQIRCGPLLANEWIQICMHRYTNQYGT